ncbi:RE1 [Symbiodinium sp. CCMP2592]|nr:RE1 [Symbiodinium sp. CCMP2592]
MRQAQSDYPHIYGQASEGGSEHSSRLQAEVQRQLEEYNAKHKEEMRKMALEVEYLRNERLQWEMRVIRVNSFQVILLNSFQVILLNSFQVIHGNSFQVIHGNSFQVILLNSFQVIHGNSFQVIHGNSFQVILLNSFQVILLHSFQVILLNSFQVILLHSFMVIFMLSPAAQSTEYTNVQYERSGCGGVGVSQNSSGANDGREPDPTKQPTAQQWLGGDQKPDPMALLAGGMAQLQAVMLQQLSNEKDRSGEKSPETVKPGVSTLPLLPQVSSSTASVDIMDWLELIAAPMSDLSDGSGEWWTLVKKEASKAYQLWTNASPIEKLRIMPPQVAELETGRWSRVNSRASSMILLALHDSVRQEMVSRRSTGSATALLFRLLTIYQPGGQQEKVTILQNLQQPGEEKDPHQAVAALRAWARWLRRCRDLGVSAPDPSLLARGLTSMTRSVLERDQEVSFRTSLVRSNLLVDTKPSYDSVDQYYHHLLAECEAMAVSSQTSGTTSTSTPNKPDPKIKPMKPEPKGGTPQPPPAPPSTSRTTTSGQGGEEEVDKRGQVPCRYFGKSFKGCARGTKCPFKHSWEGNEKEKAVRCHLCGGKHMAKECPTKKPSTPSSTSSATPAGTPKAAPSKAPPPTTTPPSTPTKTVRIDERAQVQEAPSSSTSTTHETVPDLKEVLADVGKMLKVMTASSLRKFTVKDMESTHGASIRSLTAAEEGNGPEPAGSTMATGSGTTRSSQSEESEVEEQSEGEDEGPRGLLDSGASHALKQATQEEYDKGVPVKVTLAGEDTRVLRQNVCGTVLVTNDGNERIQPIVPMGALIEDLGCSLQWNRGRLKLRHPTKGFIKIYLNNNCPEVNFKEAHKLITELEKKHLAQLSSQVNSLTARLEVLRKEEKRTWDELMKDYVKTGCQATILRALLLCPVTKDLPSEVHAMLAEGFDPDGGERYLKDLPLSKRRRRALMRSSSWVIHLHAGDGDGEKGPFNVISRGGKMVLEIDAKASKQWDLHRKEGAYRMLLWAAAQGKITDVTGTPPHTTWPTSMAPTRGPGSYPMRTTTSPYGQQPLQPLQQHRVDQETASIAKQLVVWMIASAKGRGEVGFFMDMSQDPEKLRADQPVQASFWSTEMWKSFKSVSGMKRIDFYMGAYGHKAKRPTTAATNYPGMLHMNNNWDFSSICVPSSLLKYDEMIKWSREFKEILAQNILGCYDEAAMFEEEIKDEEASLKKLTREQRREWRDHIHNDHQPYRPDCSVCVNAQATGYQHKRRKFPGMYAVAMDLAGPFKKKGRDMDFDDYKYIMVAAYRCPRQYLSSMALTELERELYVPSEDEEVPEGEDPLVLGEDDEKDPEAEESSTEEAEKLESEVEELTKKVDYATIYVTRCLRRRTGPAVLQAAKEILLQLRQTGLHVAHVHTDRAREFRTKMFKTWVNDEKLRHTKTAGGDPAGNSTAELGVKWAKARVRSLLRSAGAPPEDWPMAMDHAASSLWSKAFPSSSWTNPPAVAFGTEVWFRAKAYKGKKEKKYDPDGVRWKKGLYRGPSREVSRGHLNQREDGGLVVAKGVKFNLVEPERDLQDLLPHATVQGEVEGLLDYDLPPSKRQLREEIEFVSRKAMSENNYTTEQVVEIYNLLEELGDVDFRASKKTSMTTWFTGAFVHGGKAGVRSNLKEYPMTTKFLTTFAKKFSGEKTFSALGITRNTTLGIHRDSHNSRETSNMVLPLTEFVGGNLWIQDGDADPSVAIEKELSNGKQVLGRVLNLEKNKLVEFSPSQWHEVQPWDGDRVVILLYTPRTSKLQDEHYEELQKAGFVIDKASASTNDPAEDEEDGEAMIKRFEVNEVIEMIQAFIEVDELDFLDFNSRTRERALPRTTIKKTEVQCTPNIEEILHDLEVSGKPLEVTHTISLGDVKKNISKWYDSAVKEFTNLRDKKKAFKVTKRWNLPEGCKIVPCKGVFTVKPDASPNKYKRKTRFVACGNHVPEGSMMPEGFDLFAAGLDSTSLRTMFAFTAGSNWLTGTTDIRQAFVLAPWLGASVALQPPNIAFELGLAEPGDMWEVLMSIYGLREAPALWSGFRDQELRAAQWEAMIDGNLKRLRLQQLASDNQVWKVVDMNDPDKALGYVMVYIDDLLITGPSEILHSFFAWVSARWECDELNILKEENPIRFLGLEIHKVPGGVEVAQHGFITELLRAYNHKGSRSWSQGSRDLMVLTPEEEEAILNAEPVNLEGREAEVKQAQKRVGELLWLTGRSRPDLQYITSIMSSRITRAPEIVNELGNRLLDYLYETQYYRLKFVKIDDSEQRQQLITLSTAESEMIEAVDGETQRADIGTKALPKDRLKKLVDLWGLADRRPPRVCGTVAASESTIETGIAWDLYLVVVVLAIAVIGLWEGFKFCWKRKEAQLRALRAKANKAFPQKLTKTELKELQRILALDPEDLTRDQCACVFILYWS